MEFDTGMSLDVSEFTRLRSSTGDRLTVQTVGRGWGWAVQTVRTSDRLHPPKFLSSPWVRETWEFCDQLYSTHNPAYLPTVLYTLWSFSWTWVCPRGVYDNKILKETHPVIWVMSQMTPVMGRVYSQNCSEHIINTPRSRQIQKHV